MTLYFIGLGLSEQDISVKALNIIKSCKHIYLENYTSKPFPLDFEVIEADREMVEKNPEKTILSHKEDTAFLVFGDPFSATTHLDLYLRAKELNIDIKIIHNTSIVNAVAETGLELYKFGKTVSIPFQKDVETPIKVFEQNQSINAHTLFLLDLDPKNNKYLSVKEACEYLLKHIGNRKALAIQALGTKNQKIIYDDLDKLDLDTPPFCIIIPAKDLHFKEEEALEQLK